MAQLLLGCGIIAAAAFLPAALLAAPMTNLLGNGILTFLNLTGNAQTYDVVISQMTTDMYVNMLPAKQEALRYGLTPGITVLVSFSQWLLCCQA